MVYPPCATKASHMLSYSWGYKIGDILDTLNVFCESQPALTPKEVVVWMCCFCVNQHRVKEQQNSGDKVPFDEFKKTFSDRVLGIGKIIAMMAPWQEPLYVKRVWCDFEMFTAVKEKCEMHIMMPPEEADDLRSTLVEGKKGLDEVWKALMNIDMENAEASIEDDKINILKIIKGGVGFEEFNSIVSERLRTWMVSSLKELTAKAESAGQNAIASQLAIGDLLENLGKHKEAKEFVDAGLAACKKEGTMNSVTAAKLLECCGTCLSKGFKDPNGAMEKFNSALDIYKELKMHTSDEYVELMRNMALVEKFNNNIDGAHARLVEAKSILEANNSINTTNGAAVLKNLGAVLIDMVPCDADGALENYTQALRIQELEGTAETPAAAGLLMNIGIAKIRCGEVYDALDILKRGRRIRDRTGTLVGKQGDWLLKCITDAENHVKVLQVFAALDEDGNGMTSRQEVFNVFHEHFAM